jgi:Phytanoyl-CoA dioxygenase (PhyH)
MPTRHPAIDLAQDGFTIMPSVLSETECHGLDDVLELAPLRHAGSRNLLDNQWCADLSVRVRNSPALKQLLSSLVAVQCTYFDKNPEVNWLVSVHQDLSIPVKARIDGCGLTGWNVKEGRTFVQAPVDLLENLIAVRLHLDDSGPDNGPLRVVPRSHLLGRLPSDVQAALRLEFGDVECHVPRGGALFMRPLLLHASSKTTGTRPRRVLHFLFGPKELPFGLEWALTV